MDPYLEHPSLWPDVHNSLIAAIRDALSPLVAPGYYVALERRAYLLKPDDIALIGRPNLSVVRPGPKAMREPGVAYAGVLDVDVPLADEVEESYLAVYAVRSRELVTLIELLSPINKVNVDGRRQYVEKRAQILRTRTNLVEIDLLRAGEPMPVVGPAVESDYRILISRGWRRPHAKLYAFALRQPIPTIPVPLRPDEVELVIDLNAVLHALYGRARFDLQLDYAQQPMPPLRTEDGEWAAEQIACAVSLG